jgi:tryptophanyl-tRNA synthetase
MAADIIIHKATKVPVGKDQEQHLEMARTFGNRFNRLYNQRLLSRALCFSFGESLVKIPGLDGKGKMGKSKVKAMPYSWADTPEAIRKKVMRAVTDGGPTQLKISKNQQEIQNLFDLMKVVSTPDTLRILITYTIPWLSATAT